MGSARSAFSRRTGWAVAGAAAVLAIGLIGWLAWPSAPPVPGASRVRQYFDVRACLLTGSGGITTGPAATAWAGMGDASLATRAGNCSATRCAQCTASAVLADPRSSADDGDDLGGRFGPELVE